jgi:hypothetical protein
MRPDIGTTLPTGLADKPLLNIGKPEIASPSIGAHLDRVAAFVVGAIDQDAPHAAIAHLSEGDFLRAGEGGHAPWFRRSVVRGSRWMLGRRSAGTQGGQLRHREAAN